MLPSRNRMLLSLLLALSLTAISAFPRLKSPVAVAHASLDIDLNPYYPWAEDEEEEQRDIDKIVPALAHTATSIYGTVLLFFSNYFPGQIHIITMLRATGFQKFENAVRKTRRNFRDAIWAAVWNSPKFFKAKRSYRSLNERIGDVKEIMKETKKAKADGIVTPSEARHIQKLRRREIARYQREMKRLVKAAAGLEKVWLALDFDEIKDAVRGFFFQMMAVLATGNNEGLVAALISKWCLFLNLGSLFLDANTKLRYPISKLLYQKTLSSANIDENQAKLIEKTAEVLMFSSAGYIVVNHNSTARELNAASMSAAIIFRGIRRFVETFWDRDDDEVTVWSTGNGFLQGGTGGILMIALTGVGMYCRRRIAQGKMSAPKWILAPFQTIEAGIDKLVLVIDKVM